MEPTVATLKGASLSATGFASSPPLASSNGDLRVDGADAGLRSAVGGTQSNVSHLSRVSVAMVAKVVGAEFEERDDAFYEEASLKGVPLRPWHQWGLLVAMMFSSNSQFWNFGLMNGWGSLMVSTIISNVYFCALTAVFTELMTMLPFAGGMASFSRAAFGPFVGYAVGNAELWEYAVFIAYGTVVIGQWVTATAGTSSSLEPLWWGIQMLVAFSMQLLGTVHYVTLLLGLAAVSGLVSVPQTIPESLQLTRNQSVLGTNLALVSGFDVRWALLGFTNTTGSFENISMGSEALEAASLPTAIFWFIGIEFLPLMAEESLDFVKDAPKVVAATVIPVSILAWMVLIIQPALAKAGYMPTFMTKTRLPFTSARVPWVIMMICIVIVYLIAIVAWYEPGSEISVALGNAGIIYTTISYIVTSLAYIKLSYSCPDVKRPFKIPYGLGPYAAGYVALVSSASLAYMASEESYQLACVICAVKITLSFIEMWIFHQQFIQAHVSKTAPLTDLPNVSLDAVEHMSQSRKSLGRGCYGPTPRSALEEKKDEDQKESLISVRSVGRNCS
ncbi:hypothetical protein HK101_010705 [Irineochytrium annulatum]|nr:hypothetical protein HK101_010705 [Irineochytrium annulatum]